MGRESGRPTEVLKGELSGEGNYQLFVLGIRGISSEIGRGEIRWNGREPSATLNKVGGLHHVALLKQ